MVSTLQVQRDLETGAAGITPGDFTFDNISYSMLSLHDLAKCGDLSRTNTVLCSIGYIMIFSPAKSKTNLDLLGRQILNVSFSE